MGMPTPEEVGWVDVYETVDFDGDRVTVLRQLISGDPGFEKSGKRGDGKGGEDTDGNDCFEGGLLQIISTTLSPRLMMG
jgi:hypothetical protein